MTAFRGVELRHRDISDRREWVRRQVWHLLSFTIGGFAAVGLLFAGIEFVELTTQRRPFLRITLSIALILLSAGTPTWVVARLHRRLTGAHLLAYFGTLLLVFVLIAVLNMQIEL